LTEIKEEISEEFKLSSTDIIVDFIKEKSIKMESTFIKIEGNDPTPILKYQKSFNHYHGNQVMAPEKSISI